MKKKYILPQANVINLISQASILDGSNNNYVDSKIDIFYVAPPKPEEDLDDGSAWDTNNLWGKTDSISSRSGKKN